MIFINDNQTFHIKELNEDYNQQMLELIESCPMCSKDIDVIFTRRPDVFLLSKLHYEYLKFAGIFYNDDLIAIGMVGYEKVFVNGEEKYVFHFTDVYFKKEFRKRRLYPDFAPFFFRSSYKDSNLGYALILNNNIAAEKALLKNYPGKNNVPFAKKVAKMAYKTILVTFNKKINSEDKDFIIRNATEDDLQSIYQFLNNDYRDRLFAPVLSLEKLRSMNNNRPNFSIGSNYFLAFYKNELVGVVSAWDNREIKQTTVSRYGLKYSTSRWIYYLGEKIFSFPPLPNIGNAFKDITVCDCAIKDNDYKILTNILEYIYRKAHKQRINCINFGSFEGDPLLNACDAFFTEGVFVNLYLISKDINQFEKIKINRPYINWGLV
ncbi:MAG: hypothetical protein HQK51_10835 [Oligoflexia bacterium]|nr:hypothetical protein [Oligoflexia bacterium]